MIPLKSSKISSWRKTFLSLDLRISKNILKIREAKGSKFKFMHTLSESKSIFAQKDHCFMLSKKMLRFYWVTRYIYI